MTPRRLRAAGGDGRPAPAADHGDRNGVSRVFALSSLILALSFAGLSSRHLPAPQVQIWAAATAFASLLPAAIATIRMRRGAGNPGLSGQSIEFFALLLGATWAAMPALFFAAATPALRTFCGAMLFAVAGLGAFAFARTPKGAVAFVALITSATAFAALQVGGEFGAAFAVATALYGTSLSAMVLVQHIRSGAARRAQQENRRQQETVAFLLNDFEDGARDWLWETGKDFAFTYASPRLADILGGDPASIPKLKLVALAGPDPAMEPAWQSLRNKLQDHQLIPGEELPSSLGAGPRWLRLSARPLFDADGTFAGYRGVGHAITAERLARDQLEAARDAAEQANAAKSQFLAVISHELRTPLNAIVGFAELLNSPQGENLPAEARSDHLRTILQSSRHLQSLISDILDSTRFEKGTLRLAEQDGDAGELLEVAVKMCRDAAENANCTVIATLADGIEVRGDITRIKQVLINLITNAIKFSPSQGYVYAGLERQENGGLAFVIRDGGMGIAAEDVARIFEPFVQVDNGTARRFGGMGLGLSIARKLARLHGGDVTLESTPGAGTTARLILPSTRITWPQRGTAVTTAA